MHSTSRSHRRALFVICLTLPACYAGLEEGEGLDDARTPLDIVPIEAPQEAFCSVQITDGPIVDLESDYLPHVVHCENGGADLEALKAQAIAARSVAYSSLTSAGEICDGQGCQVYSCNGEPSDIHYQAVAETAGQFLSYGGVLTYGFYVSGDNHTSAPYCVGDSDHPMEKYVTYNLGLSGVGVEQTGLGWKFDPDDNGYGQNRGCMSQWGARCLEAQGWGHVDILRFYYGADIEIRQATGSCVDPSDPVPPPPPEPQPPTPPPPQPPPPTPPPGSCGVMLPGDILHADEAIDSCDGRFSLVVQTDGNLVLYQADVGPLWNSQTAGHTVSGLAMQPDGNLVLYDANAVATWNSGTWGSPGAWLFVQDDGNVVVYLGEQPVWNTGTCCR